MSEIGYSTLTARTTARTTTYTTSLLRLAPEACGDYSQWFAVAGFSFSIGQLAYSGLGWEMVS
jgi:hypothetical protein